MLLLVGLGNPGPKYENNRHNIGFMAVDSIVLRYSFSPYRARFQSLTAEGSLAGERILAMKPTTFMNESGRAVGEAMRYYKLAPNDVLIIHDELDLAPGRIRVKKGGGMAGHNGLRSVDKHIGKEFHRIRVGIGHPGDKDRVHGYVLTDFAKSEISMFEKIIDAMAGSAELLGVREFDAFMSKVSLILKPPRPSHEKKSAPDSTSEST